MRLSNTKLSFLTAIIGILVGVLSQIANAGLFPRLMPAGWDSERYKLYLFTAILCLIVAIVFHKNKIWWAKIGMALAFLWLLQSHLWEANYWIEQSFFFRNNLLSGPGIRPLWLLAVPHWLVITLSSFTIFAVLFRQENR